MDYTVHGILQARILEWVAVLSPGDLPNLGIEPSSPASQEDSLPRATGKAPLGLLVMFYPLRQTLCTFQGAVGC